MRQLMQNADTPVVILTGRPEAELVEEAFQLGVEDFLHKPFEMIQLRSRVLKLLRRAASDRGNSQAIKLLTEAAGSLDKILWTFEVATLHALGP